jgi:hypothetical protein
MTLKSFGCSFIFGSDLSDAVAATGKGITPSQKTWPALLSKKLGVSYSCHARPGAGNLQILERVLDQIPTSSDSDLFVIGWTWIDRLDYWVSDTKPWMKDNRWETIRPTDETDLATTYYRGMHSEYRDKFTGLCYIKLAIDALNQRDIPFVMTYQDELLFDQRWHTSESVLALQASINPHMTTFEGQTFLEWSQAHGFEISTAWHPLEAAHAAAADYLINHNLV